MLLYVCAFVRARVCLCIRINVLMLNRIGDHCADRLRCVVLSSFSKKWSFLPLGVLAVARKQI